MIDTTVKLMVESKKINNEEDADYKRWTERVKNHEAWLLKHKVTEVKTGAMLDVKDTEHIWCTATVELKIMT
eukprot:CAMPEP_0176346852 /NCGR_PEP_ID=MMETSP0126-20121128/6556_1 /TAXON_ID=141414 ORGANISM="Strombidinopsis acuminatum, Strain SPMC142" /NCGR_SAMPLE_ID=MMETSP0126 /ASSEMBLY_ACC=CAM_ASM_000229 /LENGTH=71 /DNA_ID=CAMNT_0017694611 /DNA_START=864 /DNA_END=1079 /DNA_ORIENTATION=-